MSEEESNGSTSTTQVETGAKRKKNPRHNNVIHLKNETDTLVRNLTATSDKLPQVFSIVGMPGLGKTTLAWNIYRDLRIQYEFPVVIWVYVSQQFNKKDVLLTILQNIEQDDYFGKSVDDLVKVVRKRLERGKFLIFFDDVWTTQVWKEIEDFLPIKDNRQGRVLITTRNHEVVRFANEKDLDDLRFLNENESWELLQLEVFGNLDDCPPKLVDIGKQIAKKCNGLPFAIVVIGGVLYDKWRTTERISKVKEEWSKLSLKSYIDKLSYGGREGNQDESLRDIISLSYNSLSYELKDCFLYLGVFPEDIKIPVWKLTQLWIAEGFIKQQKDRSLEETAQSYLKELIDKNLLMIDKIKPDGEIKTCRVHDSIRNFCSDTIFQEIRLSNEGVLEPAVDKIEDCRRICIHSCVMEFLAKKPSVLKARSFLSFSKQTIMLEKEQVPYITEAFSLLRVLDVNMAFKFREFPDKLTRLMLLKYVTLSSDEFEVLPKDIYKLWNVQTLVVYTCLPILKIKANIWKMIQLRHFKTKASIILVNKNEKGEGGENLRTLNRLSPQCCTDTVFNKAKNLKALGIRGEFANKKFPDLEKLKYLEKLKLVNGLSHEEAKQKPLQCVPQCKEFPPKLKILILSGTYLKWTHMSTLGKNGTLEVLKLKDNAFVGDLWNARDIGFTSLESLHISDTDLYLWTASGEAFLNLQDVVLKNCKQLREVPPELVMRLELLYMDGVGNYAVSSAMEIEKIIQKKQGKQTVRKSEFKLVIAPHQDDYQWQTSKLL